MDYVQAFIQGTIVFNQRIDESPFYLQTHRINIKFKLVVQSDVLGASVLNHYNIEKEFVHFLFFVLFFLLWSKDDRVGTEVVRVVIDVKIFHS